MTVQLSRKGLIAEQSILYLSRTDVLSCLSDQWEAAILAVSDAYRSHAEGDVNLPKAEYLKYNGRPSYDRIIPLLGYLGGEFNVSGLKQICSSTDNIGRGFPRASGLIIMNEPESNRPYCIMEGAEISAMRTAAVTGLALGALAEPSKSQAIALLGCGTLATAHLSMLASRGFAGRASLRIHDPNRERTDRLASAARERGFAVECCATPIEAVRGAEIIIPMTTAEEPYLRADALGPRWIYSAVSLLDAQLDIYEAAELIIVDDIRQSIAEGRPLDRLSKAGKLPSSKMVEIGKWLSGPRTKVGDRVLFNPMGTVITDLAVASLAFKRALERDLGTRLSV
ncbi:hypothetical protein [Bradyrhizobium sp. SZCCHNR2035]|uniref:hypothetical protein n=1 Tax=Bradyrhizobium sp. SZCCHNR2035 TaxID=3057386 RepID=UPI002915CA1A|nr:hypothetical protein [Bradyrhizobium sp. SZCCHNR2035]